MRWNILPLERKCCHFDEIFITGFTGCFSDTVEIVLIPMDHIRTETKSFAYELRISLVVSTINKSRNIRSPFIYVSRISGKYIFKKCTLYKKLRLKLPYRTYTFRQYWSYLPETHRSRFISQLVQHYSESFIMTSSNGNIFRVTPRSALLAGNSLVTGEFPAQRLVTRGFDVFFDLRLNQRLSKQSWVWWFGTLSCSLWRHCNVICIWTPHTSLVVSTRNKSRSIRTIHISLDDFRQIYV